MADVFRRLILKPPAATPERLARLADALQEAIHAQNRLAARSPHVLRFVGALDQDERAFFVEHEPAAGISPRDLFDSAAPRAAEEQLLQTMAGLGDALAAAHTAGSTRPVVHGGLCPGVVLTGPDGLVRITDFGFAPAICKILGVESYLNLAVAPGADGAGVWEILGPDVADRDDRICAFVDPDKYGQESLASFELGSDIIAAGLVLYVLAEHVHAYLYFEPQAHRVVDMARMMGFGVPNVFSRKDLCESANPAVQVWRELVGTMLSRLPAQRPSAAQIVQRFTSVGPKVDLDAIKAQRWLSQLENLLEAKVWKELEVTVKERPQLKSWPKELLAQAQSLEARAREVMEREGQRAAFEAEQQTATKWFVRLQNAVKAEDWDAAQELLSEKPQIENWPEGVEQAVGGLAAKIAQVGILRKARAWEKVLQKTFEAGNWTGVGKLLAQRPALDPWPDDMRDYVASIESAYREHLEEQERERLRIAEQHSQATKWFERAKSLADKEQWRETLDWLARPPELEHWPEDVRAEADRLLKNCRLHLTDAVSTGLDAITETVRRHAASIVDEVVAQGLAGLVRPQRVETAVDLIMWAPPGTEADGRAQLTVRLRPPTEGAATPPIPGELDFVLKEDVVQLCGGQGKFREQVAEALPRQLASLQKTQLGAFEHGLHATVFAEAAVHAQLTEPASPRAGAVRIDLLGNKDAGTTLQVDLRWSDDTLSWAAADTNRLVAQALEIATAVTQRVVLADLLARSTMLNAYQGVLAVQLAATEQPTPGELPKSLPFTVNVSVNPAGHGEPVPLCDGTAVCDHVGRASCDVDVAAMESRLTQLVVQSQEQSRQSLADGFKRIARTAGSRTQVGAPKRSKTPVGEVAFDIKSKGGNPLVLKAAWNTNTFVYDLPADWEKQVQTLLGPAGTWPPKAAAMPPPVGAKQPVRPAAAAPRRKLVMWASLAGAGLIVVVGVVLFVSSRGKTALPPQPVPEPVPVVNAGAEPRPGTSTTGE